MTPLIKILIISDDIEKWLSFFRGYHVVTKKTILLFKTNGFILILEVEFMKTLEEKGLIR